MNGCPVINQEEKLELAKQLKISTAGVEAIMRDMLKENPEATIDKDSINEYFLRNSVKERDELFVAKTKEQKLASIKAEKTKLNQILSTTTTEAQSKVIQKLIDKLEEYEKAVEAGVQQVSVTNFKGVSSLHADVDVNLYIDFKHFGTFIHHVLDLISTWRMLPERAKKYTSANTRDEINTWFTKEVFDKIYNEFQADPKTAFNIDNMTTESMYQATFDIAMTISTLISGGYKILPEITLIGDAYREDNLKIIGRADILAISPEGRVSVLDFKTKKVKDLIIVNEGTNNVYIDVTKAIINLAKDTYTIESAGQSDNDFIGGKRSTFDEWFIQLELYSNMLRQMGLDVDISRNNIISLLYETTPDLKFKAQKMVVFNGYEYYQRARVHIPDDNRYKNSKPLFADENYTRNKFNKYLRIINKALPYKEEEEAEQTAKSIQDLYDIRPDEKQAEEIMKSVYERAKANIEAISKDIHSKNYTEDIKELKLQQLKYLKTIVRNIEEQKDKEDKSLFRGLIFAKSLATIKDEITRINTEFSNINEQYTKALTEYGKNPTEGNKRDYIKLYSKLLELHNQNKAAGDALGILYEIAINIKNNPKNNISEDSPIFKNVLSAYAQYNSILNDFRDATIPMIVNVLKGIGKESFENIRLELTDAFMVEQKRINKRLAKLKQGKLGLIRRGAMRVAGVINKDLKEQYSDISPDNNSEIALEIARLEKRKDQLNQILAGLKYDDTALSTIVNNMKDPTSILYLGNRTLYTQKGGIDIIDFSKFQATITDSDLGVASVMIMLKNAEGMMHDNLVNDKGLHNLANATDSILSKKGLTIEQLNDLISGRRNVTYYNINTGEVTTSNQLYLVKPMSEEYENTYRKFQSDARAFKEAEKLIRAKYNKAIKTGNAEEIAALKREYDAAKQKSYEHTKAMISWMLENCNLPYKDAYYKLQAGLPDHYKQQIDDIYLQMYIISSEDLMMQSDDDADMLLTLKAEIRRIKQLAKEENTEYARIIEQMENMYEPVYNEARYNAMLKNAEIQFADYPEQLAKWKEKYQITRPNSEWFKKRAEIYDEIASIYGNSTDDELSNLFRQRRDIMNRFTFNKIFNPRIMTSDDIAELDGVNNAISEILNDPNRAKAQLSDEDWNRIKKLKLDLANLQERVKNPIYEQEMKKRTDLLIDKKEKYVRATSVYERNKTKENLDKLLEAERDYNNYMAEYKKWYEERHEDPFVNPLIGVFNRNLSQPKAFNFIFKPTSDEYMETIGNPDYFTEWKLKEEAKNPNYIEGIDNIPLPKGVISMGDGLYSLSPEGMSSKNIDPKFKAIVADKDLKNYYDTLTTYYFGLQKMMVGQKMGYKIPGFAASKIENFKRLGFKKGLSKEMAIAIDKHLKFQSSEQDFSENIFGDLGGIIRGRFTRQLGEELQTTDSINAIYKFAVEAHYNKAMQEAQPQVEGVIEYYKEQIKIMKNSKSTDPAIQAQINKRIKEWTSAVDSLEYEKRKFIQGQIDDAQDRKIKKGLNLLFQYISFMRLGFDITNQVKNYTAGSVQFWIAAGNGSKHYTDKTAIQAYRQVYGVNGFLHNYFADWGKISNLHESTMLYRIFNPLQKDMIKYVDEITGGRTRRLGNKLTNFMELAYLVQDKGDTLIGLVTMYAVLFHYKFNVIDPITKQPVLDANGNNVQVSAAECYIKGEDGTLKIRNDVDYTKEDQLRLKRIIIAEMRRAQGNYAKSDQTRIEAKTQGKLLFFYRKYFIPLFLNRFGTLRPSWETGEVSLGYWRALVQAFGAFGAKATLKQFMLGSIPGTSYNGLTSITDIENPTDDTHIEHKMGDLYARKINQAARDTLAMIILSSLSMLALAMVRKRKDEDEPLSIIEGNAIRILWGTAGEVMSMFPLGGGSQEYIRNFTTALPMVSELTRTIKVIDHALKAMLVMLWNGGAEPDPEIDSELYQEWYKDAFYQKKSGPYEAGTLKLKKDFIDFTGFDNIRDLFTPEVRIDQLQGKQ